MSELGGRGGGAATPEFRLSGEHIRLEPLDLEHVGSLLEASAEDPALYRWSPVPTHRAAATAYVATASAWRDAGTAAPFVIVGRDDRVIGSTRFWNIEKWAWPESADRRRETAVDGCEIGYTWLAASAVRTAANTEAKLLMLTHAFEVWRVLRVCFHTDVRNERSAAALERLGAKFEGVLRAHRLAADAIARDSKRYSILAAEWPDVKARLQTRLARG
jgi:RimJ/RimL family protein N-acetyltransferase